MPIYEYVCEPCDERFEAFLATSDDQAVCPQCQGVELRRVMSTFAAVGGAKAPQASAPAPKPRGGCGSGCGCH